MADLTADLVADLVALSAPDIDGVVVLVAPW